MKSLFQVPPDEFTKARDERVRELKAEGKDDEAKRVAKLRKPPIALWIANQLGRIAAGDVKALIDATEKLRKGHDLRESMREQRDALTRLGDAAGRAALEAGTKLTLALQRRVQTTVQSAAAVEPEALRDGTLEHELEATGFEGLSGATLPPPQKREEPVPEKKEDAARHARELKAAEQAAHRLHAQAAKLEQAAKRAEESAAAARKEAGEAREKANQAATRALELRRGQ